MSKEVSRGGQFEQTFEGHLQSICYENDKINEPDVRAIVSGLDSFGAGILHTKPLFYVIDYTKARYCVMSGAVREITGEPPEAFLEGGIPKLLDVYNGEDFKVYNEHVFSTNMSFLRSQPVEDHQQFVFSYNFRVRHRNGHYVPIYQRGCYLTSPDTGLPLYSLGMVMNITPFKKDFLMHHTIEKASAAGCKMLAEYTYFPHEEDKLLTRRERQILQYMAEGWCSKQIADRIDIAENTIANHRKNMLRKTGARNVAELVAFACKSGLI
ncbi:LuxR C-terminal-related transcriptional regulator [Chitinophaga niabensis]|uniref:Regulatory protein, luxR family n=1 Tax=Chitinophaga niabensis TaxID=536979 RepID=A0A1N6DS12_9BACT|nr:LuxR C-terminal-related transcriptional regulator [Chitinophaga niabensis]SIN73566.1 regulatory protein, luxR family [Chitinophaga niabensis]